MPRVLTEEVIARYLRPEQVDNVFHISPDRRLLYIANQKAACSTVKFVLHRMYDPNTSADLSKVHDKSISPMLSPRDIGLANFLDELNRGAYFVFTVVRDPYARLLSGYRDKVARPSRQQQRIIERISSPDPTLTDFVNLLGRTPPAAMNPHWRPQWINTFVNYLPIDLVARTERLNDDLKAVAEQVGATCPYVPKLNQTQGSESDARDLMQSADLINYIYRGDFREFGYPIWEGDIDKPQGTE